MQRAVFTFTSSKFNALVVVAAATTTTAAATAVTLAAVRLLVFFFNYFDHVWIQARAQHCFAQL